MWVLWWEDGGYCGGYSDGYSMFIMVGRGGYSDGYSDGYSNGGVGT